MEIITGGGGGGKSQQLQKQSGELRVLSVYTKLLLFMAEEIAWKIYLRAIIVKRQETRAASAPQI